MLRILRRTYVRSTFIVFPEVPEGNAASKPFESARASPLLKDANPDGLYVACIRQASDYDVEVSKHSDALVSAQTAKTFDAVFAPLENLHQNLSENVNLARTLAVVNSKDKRYMKTYRSASNAAQSALNDRWMKPGLFNAVNQLRGDQAKDAEKIRGAATRAQFEAAMVRMYMNKAVRSGARLSLGGLRKYRSLQLHLSTTQRSFARRVEHTEAKFLHAMRASHVTEMPLPVRHALFGPESVSGVDAGAAAWQMQLNALSYEATMTYCSDRATRWNVFHAYGNRAARGVHVDLAEQNEKHVADIRETRHELGVVLGTHFCDLTLEERACRSLGTLKDFLLSASEAHMSQAQTDLGALREFSALPSLDRWDLAFFKRRFLERQFGNAPARLFEFDATRDRLFRYMESLLSVRVNDATSKLPRDALPADGVRYYEVFDARSDAAKPSAGSETAPLGSFYLDARPRIVSLSMPLRHGSVYSSRKPITYLRIGTVADGGLQKLHFASFLAFASELANVFETVVQGCPFGELQEEQATVNIDVFPILPRLLLRLLLTDAEQTARLLGVAATPLVRDMSEAYRRFRSIDVALNVYRAALELELHVTQKNHDEVRNELWPHLVPFFKLHRFDNSTLSATDMFCESVALRRYVPLFANMVAANVFESCRAELSSSNEADRARVGQRIRQLLIEPRCALHYGDVFEQLAQFDAKLRTLKHDVDLTYY